MPLEAFALHFPATEGGADHLRLVPIDLYIAEQAAGVPEYERQRLLGGSGGEGEQRPCA